MLHVHVFVVVYLHKLCFNDTSDQSLLYTPKQNELLSEEVKSFRNEAIAAMLTHSVVIIQQDDSHSRCTVHLQAEGRESSDF